MEDTRAVAGWLASQELLEGKVTTPDEVVDMIDAVKAEDVARVGQKLLNPDDLRLAVVGPHRGEQQFLKLLHF
jgi:predicted Zn-dependent peptidase